MATQLQVYNEALRILGEPLISSTSDTTERGKILTDCWPLAVETAIEQGAWQAGTRRVALVRAVSTPAFGRTYYYTMPTDCARVVFVTSTGIENDGIVNYNIENDLLATDEPVVYIRYISDAMISNVPQWKQGFADFVAAEMAFRAAPKLAPSKVEVAKSILDLRRRVALSSDAVDQPPQMRKMGKWAMAHRSRFTGSGPMGTGY